MAFIYMRKGYGVYSHHSMLKKSPTTKQSQGSFTFARLVARKMCNLDQPNKLYSHLLVQIKCKYSYSYYNHLKYISLSQAYY